MSGHPSPPAAEVPALLPSETSPPEPPARPARQARRRARDAGSTPLMEQYAALKRRHPDAILFFRLGDFYEMFHEDAELASRLLGLTLTSRNRHEAHPVPLAGVPWHQRDAYVGRLLRLGHKVAICEQLEDPSQAKGLVERGVTEVLTPGSLLAEPFLEGSRSQYLAALSWWPQDDASRLGFSLIDASTGEFRAGEAPLAEGLAEVARVRVAEWLVHDRDPLPEPIAALLALGGTVTRLSIDDFALDQAGTALRARFGKATPDWGARPDAHRAASAAICAFQYLDRVQGGSAAQLRPPVWLDAGDALVLGEATKRNLEIFEPGPSGKPEHTLWGVIDRSVSAAGARRLRRWLERPLLDPQHIDRRLEAVETLVERGSARAHLRESLGLAHDLERLTARLAAGKATPRDLVALARTLEVVPAIAEAVDEALMVSTSPARPRDDRWLRALRERLAPQDELASLLARGLVDDPPLATQEGGLIRPGFDAECDRLHAAARSGKTWILELEARERERTGIPSLKIGFNRVFGYYLEVTKTHQSRVPADFERRQTLTGAERYVTAELKRLEGEVLGAEEKLRQAEYQRFLELRAEAAGHVLALAEIADALADLDAVASLAEAATRFGWVRPRVTGGDGLRLLGARHPVVERAIGSGRYVPNDVELDRDRRQILLVTGPNMAGKSTYLRSVGLIAILAQAGSFVPAREAEIGVVDRLFTRIGAADAVAAGHSTFMVEMVEAAEILRQTTPRSLVLLDELGRGTSTYDGLALAWSITEELHRDAGARPRTLFATHYHELTRLAGELPRLVNLHVRVREVGDDVVFLHEVSEGPADRSYGIHVARLAGLPPGVLQRARRILGDLESQRASALPAERSPLDPQLGLFDPGRAPDPARRDRLAALSEALGELDLDQLTPLAALNLLSEWKERFGGS